jgi:RNA polymerase sigma factor (TIGR02999 family)
MSADVTTLLGAVRNGEPAAANRLFNLLYGELKQLAHRQLNRPGHGQIPSLDTTALVHESYLKLIDGGELKPEDRKHFFAYTATVMRSVIVDYARSQLAEKRGGQQLQVTLNTGVAESTPAGNAELLQIHEAIDELSAIDPRMGKLVEMRYFAGLSEQEAADALEISKRTAQRDWEKARLFLYASLQRK